MGGLFGGGGSVPQPVKPEPVPEGPTEEEKAEALEKEKTLERNRKGRASTLVTGGLGVTSEAPVARKTLLGQ